jgi:hypothetical protein
VTAAGPFPVRRGEREKDKRSYCFKETVWGCGVFCSDLGLFAADDLLEDDFAFAAVDFFTEEFVFFTFGDLAAEADLVVDLLAVLAFGSGFCVLSAGNFAEAGFSCAVLACAG